LKTQKDLLNTLPSSLLNCLTEWPSKLWLWPKSNTSSTCWTSKGSNATNQWSSINWRTQANQSTTRTSLGENCTTSCVLNRCSTCSNTTRTSNCFTSSSKLQVLTSRFSECLSCPKRSSSQTTTGWWLLLAGWLHSRPLRFIGVTSLLFQLTLSDTCKKDSFISSRVEVNWARLFCTTYSTTTRAKKCFSKHSSVCLTWESSTLTSATSHWKKQILSARFYLISSSSKNSTWRGATLT